MKQRTERMGVEIQAAMGEIMARGEIKDPRVRNAGLVTVTQVRVTGDLREARVVFTVHGADQARLERTRQGLTSARSYLQAALARRLRTRNTPTLTFEIDRALDHAFRLDGILREVAATRAAETTAESRAESPSEDGTAGSTGGEGDGDGDGDGDLDDAADDADAGEPSDADADSPRRVDPAPGK